MRECMKLRGYFFFVYFLIVLAFSCKNDTVGIDDLRTSSNPDIIATSAEHLAFPDLIWHKDFWYVAFRMADAHTSGTYSEIKVMKSTDFIIWEECNSFELIGLDLRDPKFSFNDAKDSLYLHFWAISNDGDIRKNIYASFDNKDNRFLYDHKTIKMEKQYPNDWLWRPVWKDGELYVGGYNNYISSRLYIYKNLNETPLLYKNIISPITTEMTIRFRDDEIYILVRMIGGTLLGIVKSINDEIDWQSLPLGEIGGPNMILRNDTVFLGGRINNLFSIYTLTENNKRLELYKTFLTEGECGYPGMYLKDEKIYGVYYTQNSGKYEIKSFSF